jgi:hypothetical protein
MRRGDWTNDGAGDVQGFQLPTFDRGACIGSNQSCASEGNYASPWCLPPSLPEEDQGPRTQLQEWEKEKLSYIINCGHPVPGEHSIGFDSDSDAHVSLVYLSEVCSTMKEEPIDVIDRETGSESLLIQTTKLAAVPRDISTRVFRFGHGTPR